MAEAPVEFGRQLKAWRRRRRVSQLDLALTADVSSRHVSFVETGRSRPSRAMVLQLAGALDVPLRDRNALLMAAGHAPVYRRHDLADAALAPLRRAIDHMLRGHEPYPAFVIDRLWNVVQANETALALFAPFMPAQGPVNAMRLLFAPGGLRESVENWPEVASATLLRLRREVALAGNDAELSALLAEAEAYDGGAAAAGVTLDSLDSPVLGMRLRLDGQRLSVFSTLATFSTAQDIMVRDLRIEHVFPADAATEAIFAARAGRPAADVSA